ncbi:MAG: hypothetical protein II711_04295, partial [Clostridia bacterium]|nr:hypothetical protein [Clostridia bacterium]
MIRTKLILRNVLKKPLRSIVIILSLAAVAFAALFCIDGINMAASSLTDYFRSRFGDTDILITYGDTLNMTEEDLPKDCKILTSSNTIVSLSMRNSYYYNYVTKEQLQVIGVDSKAAADIRLFDEAYPTKDGVTITKNIAEKLNKKVGDTISFYGENKDEYHLKILAIAEQSRYLQEIDAIITTPELCNQIADVEKGFNSVYIDAPDEKIGEYIEEWQEKYPDYLVFGTVDKDTERWMQSTLSIYYLIFIVVILMVCFIVVSMSNHIANERLSMVGMLRSLGGSISGTGAVLLAESAFYGLCGGLIGTGLYFVIATIFMSNLYDPSMGGPGELNFFLVCGVVMGVVLLQCIFSVAAIMRVAKTPIRDIIFGTKESAYFPSIKRTVVGGILLAAGIVLYFAAQEFVMIPLAAFLSMVGLILILPYISQLLSRLLSMLFRRWQMPVAKLAVKEFAAKKSTVSTVQLIVSSISLTITVCIVSVALINLYVSNHYDCNILIQSTSQPPVIYDYLDDLDGVEGTEKLYYQYITYGETAELNGEPLRMTVVAMNDGGFRYYQGIRECPDSIGENEVSVDKLFAARKNLKLGDKINVRLHTEKILPKEMTLTVTSLCDAGYFKNGENVIMININDYRKTFHDFPSEVLVKSEEGREAEVLQMIERTLGDGFAQIKTSEEYRMEQQTAADSILSILYAIIFMGFAIALLGTFNNML